MNQSDFVGSKLKIGYLIKTSDLIFTFSGAFLKIFIITFVRVIKVKIKKPVFL